MSEVPPVSATEDATPVVQNSHGVSIASDDGKVMADSGVTATVSVSLHPLVIMNISEHWTR